jgi:hypothetical protein
MDDRDEHDKDRERVDKELNEDKSEPGCKSSIVEEEVDEDSNENVDSNVLIDNLLFTRGLTWSEVLFE